MVAKVDVRRLKSIRPGTPPDEQLNALIKAFRRAVSDAGVIHEWKKHEFYEKPSDKKRRTKREKVREAKKALNMKNRGKNG